MSDSALYRPTTTAVYSATGTFAGGNAGLFILDRYPTSATGNPALLYLTSLYLSPSETLYGRFPLDEDSAGNDQEVIVRTDEDHTVQSACIVTTHPEQFRLSTGPEPEDWTGARRIESCTIPPSNFMPGLHPPLVEDARGQLFLFRNPSEGARWKPYEEVSGTASQYGPQLDRPIWLKEIDSQAAGGRSGMYSVQFSMAP